MRTVFYASLAASLFASCRQTPALPGVTSTPSAEPSRSLERAAAGAAIDDITQALRDTAPACFSTRGYPAWFIPDSAFLRERAPSRRFLLEHECDLTHTGMNEPLRDAEGRPLVRPPRYVAPHVFRINRPHFDGSRRGRIRIERHSGSWSYWYECHLDIGPMHGEQWRATCRVVDSLVR
jgi:hypothetical protein